MKKIYLEVDIILLIINFKSVLYLYIYGYYMMRLCIDWFIGC